MIQADELGSSSGEKALGAPRAVSWAVASNEPRQQKWPAASRAAPPGALPGDWGLFPPAQHSLLDHIYILQPALRTHTRYTEDIAKLEWDQWKTTTMVRAGDMTWEACWVSKACSAQGKAGSRDTNILGGFQDLTGQSSEQPNLISQLALLGAGGALGTSWSPRQNELSYETHWTYFSEMLGVFWTSYKTSNFSSRRVGDQEKVGLELLGTLAWPLNSP